MRRPFRPSDGARIANFFCDFDCKAVWQRRQKPVDEAWLRRKYLIEKMSAPDIAAIVNRNSKQVWQWLKGYGIPTRPRGSNASANLNSGRNPGFKLSASHKAKLRADRLRDGHFPKQPDGSPYWKGKTGSSHPSWNGGNTPERQTFYSSDEWNAARKQAYTNDGGSCRRCGASKDLDIHHIFPFPIVHLRAQVWNLCVLCKTCHRFVHGLRNTDREFLPPFAIYRFRDGREINMSYRPKVKVHLPGWLL
jgi:hypothetical protein